MTDEELVTAVRQVLVEEIIPEIRAVSAKLDGMHDSFEQSSQRTLAKMDSLHREIIAIRGDIAQMRAEWRAMREQVFGSSSSSGLIQ